VKKQNEATMSEKLQALSLKRKGKKVETETNERFNLSSSAYL
jgi:hypothetical protein